MRKKTLSGYLFYIALVVIYLAAVGLMWGFLQSISLRNNLSTEYEIERTAFTFLELFRENGLAGNLEIVKNLKGFGIYKPDGTPLFIWGSAPARVDARQAVNNSRLDRFPSRLPVFDYNSLRNTLCLTMPLNLMLEHTMPMRRFMPGRLEAPGFVYIEQYTPGYWQSHRLLWGARILIPLCLLLIAGLIAYLYNKNRNYRTRLASQLELVRLGEISRTLSHEIKNPLSAIRIQTGILKKTIPAGKQQEVKIIEEEVQRLGILTNHISDFLRDPAGTPEKIFLTEFVTELIKRFEFPIQLDSEVNSGLTVLFDKERLRSVLENIIKNSIESYHSQRTQQRMPVEIFIRQENNRPVLSVCDRGQGIAPEIRDKVFDPAFSGKAEGNGIGLAIAKRFMEALAGSISLLPREGGGTEVKLNFAEV